MLPMGAWVEVLSAFGQTAAVGLPTSKMGLAAYELLVSYRTLGRRVALAIAAPLATYGKDVQTTVAGKD